MGRQSLDQLRLAGSHLAAEHFFELAIFADQPVDPFLEAAAFESSSSFREDVRRLNEGRVFVQLGLQRMRHVVGLATDLLAVHLLCAAAEPEHRSARRPAWRLAIFLGMLDTTGNRP